MCIHIWGCGFTKRLQAQEIFFLFFFFWKEQRAKKREAKSFALCQQLVTIS